MKNIKTLLEIQKELISNPDLQTQFKNDPVKAIQQFQAAVPDDWVYRMVVGALGFAILLVIIGIVILVALGKPIEANVITIFASIVSGAVGALAGLLAPAPPAN